MQKILQFLSFVLLAQGAGSLVHYFVGWFDLWAVVHRIGALDGYEVFASVVLMVLGLLVGAVSDRFE